MQMCTTSVTSFVWAPTIHNTSLIYSANMFCCLLQLVRGFPGGSVTKNTPINVGDTASISESEDPLKKEMATHSGILAWEIPRTEEPGGLQSTLSRFSHILTLRPHELQSLQAPLSMGYSPWGCKRVGHDLVTQQQHSQGTDVSRYCLYLIGSRIQTLRIGKHILAQ